MNRTSTKRAQQLKEYTKVKRKFLKANQWCFKCFRKIPPKDRTLHHAYGRVGALLCWVPGFRMACMPCHNWVETHRNDAVKLGLRAPNNLFGRPSKVIPQ